ncbi:MipA/OmpV family protein [uncultured Ramlibacter sp.]|uniref:MipA/OmpV family protein n=1 Tax=uncultured Ramlibacter sp. TaxID=260755 RepID=UPI00261BA908|nr:MipA/OmpV family protein [uncultured Ramlibacter sp.]
MTQLFRLLAPLAALLATAAPVHAQTEPAKDAWNFNVGLGVVSQPDYPGSDSQKTRVAPLFIASKGPWFFGALPNAGVPFGAGFNFVDTPTWRFGIAGGSGFAKPREESDDARLAGLGDIDNTAQLALFGSYAKDWFTARAAVTTDVGGNGHGTFALVDLEGRYHVSSRFWVSAAPGFTLADRNRQQTFFGIDAEQSASSGRPQYHPEGGLNSWRLALGANYGITPQFGLGGRVVFSRLQGDAARSPITQDASQATLSIFTSYRF